MVYYSSETLDYTTIIKKLSYRRETALHLFKLWQKYKCEKRALLYVTALMSTNHHLK